MWIFEIFFFKCLSSAKIESVSQSFRSTKFTFEMFNKYFAWIKTFWQDYLIIEVKLYWRFFCGKTQKQKRFRKSFCHKRWYNAQTKFLNKVKLEKNFLNISHIIWNPLLMYLCNFHCNSSPPTTYKNQIKINIEPK